MNNYSGLRHLRGVATYVGLLSLIVFGALFCSQKAAALAANPNNTLIRGSNTFYAYVGSGENVDINFTKVTDNLLSSGAEHDVVITVSKPGTANVTCTVLAGAASGTDCDLPNETAPTAGIWRVTFDVGGSLLKDVYSWQIGVQTGSTDIPGRVWTEDYEMNNPTATPTANFSFWYQSQLGYLYKATYNDFDGIDSSFTANNLGIVKASDCTPAYRSILRNSVTYTTAGSSCTGWQRYKQFFETPDPSLPATSGRWDASTDWLLPNIMTLGANSLAFTPQSTGSRTGNLTFNLIGYSGSFTVKVDANDDGDYSDPVDRQFTEVGNEGLVTVAFDGKDGQGNSIDPSQNVGFQVLLDKASEIHFVNTDVERRGSLSVERSNGPLANRTILFWDDSSFPNPDSNRCGVFPIQTDGSAGVDSTLGVHGWNNDACPSRGNSNNGINGSWGDFRNIDDWARVNSSVAITAHVLGASTSGTAAAELANTGGPAEQLALFALGLVAFSGTTLFGLYRSTRRPY